MGRRTMQVEAIADGTVVDHIPSAVTLRVVQLLAGPHDQVFIGVNLRSAKVGSKGVVKIAGRELSETVISRLALLAPGATMSIIRGYRVIHKSPIPVPPAFLGIARCPNGNCITNHEQWESRFEVIDRRPLIVRCHHCERSFPADELALV